MLNNWRSILKYIEEKWHNFQIKIVILKYSIYGLDVKRQRFFSGILAPRKIWVLLKSYILTGSSKRDGQDKALKNWFLEKRAL